MKRFTDSIGKAADKVSGKFHKGRKPPKDDKDSTTSPSADQTSKAGASLVAGPNILTVNRPAQPAITQQAASGTTSPNPVVKPGVETLRVELPDFWKDADPSVSSLTGELGEARKSYQEAMEFLSGVLEKMPKKFLPEIKAYLNTAKQDEISTMSFAAITAALDQHNDEQAKRIGSRVGAFMNGLIPLGKLVLGAAGSIASQAFAPASTIGTGLVQVLALLGKVSEDNQHIIDTLDNAWRDRYNLSRLQTIPPDMWDNSVHIMAIDLATSLVKFLAETIVWLNRNFFMQLVLITGGADRVERSIKALELARIGLRNALLDDMCLTEKAKQLQTSMDRTLKLLAPDFPRHQARLNSYKDACVKDTASDLINGDDFQEWLTRDMRVIWCSGVGKHTELFKKFTCSLT